MLSGRTNHRNIPRRTGYGHVVTAALSTLITLALFAGSPLAAWAHGPKEVALSYDETKRSLEVRISHPSQNPGAHYINKVEIKKNGQTISAVEYRNQPQQDPFVYDYPVEIGPGDSVEVKGSCNIFGSKTVKLDAQKTR